MTFTSLLLVGLFPTIPLQADHECTSPASVVESVRLFDGERVLANATVLFHCNEISGVFEDGSQVDPPDDAIRIDGRGKTLLPGLIDAHVHVKQRSALGGNGPGTLPIPDQPVAAAIVWATCFRAFVSVAWRFVCTPNGLESMCLISGSVVT